MSDTLSETKACDLLARIFRSRGYAIRRNVLFHEYGVEFHADGWDPKARVGFEFLTSEDDDHDDLSLEEYKTLSAAQQRGELSLFILDEVEPLSEADLVEMANDFLDETAAAKRTGRGAKKAKAKPQRSAAKKAVRKKPVRRKAADKGATGKKTGRVKAAKTPTARKRPAKKKRPARG